MPKVGWRFIVLVAALALVQGGACASPAERSASPARKFVLVTKGSRFFIENKAARGHSRTEVPRVWLVPPQEEAAISEGSVVSPFAYSRETTSFPVGNGLLGLHLSSYELFEPRGGSMSEGWGRDVLIVFDPKRRTVTLGIDLGQTKSRSRGQGCCTARFAHLLVADIDGDGSIDVGVIREEIRRDEDENGNLATPYFVQTPVRWFVFDGTKWSEGPQFDGNIPERYEELPLLGITSSPVDYAALRLWQTYDASRWPRRGETAPLFVPAYRRVLGKADEAEIERRTTTRAR